MNETDSRQAVARRRPMLPALLAAAALSGAGGGVLYGEGAASVLSLLSYMVGAGIFGLLIGMRPALMRRSPSFALSLVALLLGSMAAVHGDGATGALGALSALVAGCVASGALSSTLAGLSEGARAANSAAYVGAAWILAVFAGAAVGHSLHPSLGAFAAAALAAAGQGLLRAVGHWGRDFGERSGQTPSQRQVLDPHVLLALAGAGLGVALAGLAAPTVAGQAVTAARLFGWAALGALIGVGIEEMLRWRTGVARLAAPFGCAALGFILLQGALSAPIALAAAALIGAGLGALPSPLLAWRQTTSPNRAGIAVAALSLGQAAGALAWGALSASPPPLWRGLGGHGHPVGHCGLRQRGRRQLVGKEDT